VRLTTPRFSQRALYPAIAVLSTGYRPLGSRPRSRAAGWSAATLCSGPTRTVLGRPAPGPLPGGHQPCLSTAADCSAFPLLTHGFGSPRRAAGCLPSKGFSGLADTCKEALHHRAQGSVLQCDDRGRKPHWGQVNGQRRDSVMVRSQLPHHRGQEECEVWACG
jgi:hypothetical protein